MAKLLSGTRIYGNLVVDTWANAASANISGTTTSTSTTTGALIVAGGVGVSGNLNVGGNVAITGNLSITGNITSVNYETVTNTEYVTTLVATTVNAATIGNSGATLTGTLSTAAQTNITSVGTLTGLTVSGTATFTGNTDLQNTVYGRGVYDSGTRVVSTSSGAGNLTISGTGINLTAVGPGAVTTGSSTAIPVITTDAYGRISAISTSAVSTTISLAGTSGTGSVAGGGTLTFASTNGITATASGSTITISSPQDLQTTASPTFANVTVANIIINTGAKRNGRNIVTNYSGNTAPATPLAGDEWFRGNTGVLYKYVFDNVTSTNNWIDISSALYNANTAAVANTIALRDSGGNLTATNFLGIASSAKYADLAEMYTADDAYGPATVVVFGGDAEITVTTESHDPRVAGVISTNPAYLMNSELPNGLPVAFTGRVPCLVQGPVNKGDLLVTSATPGVAQRLDNSLFRPGCVVGKSLGTIQNDEVATVEVAVGRY